MGGPPPSPPPPSYDEATTTAAAAAEDNDDTAKGCDGNDVCVCGFLVFFCLFCGAMVGMSIVMAMRVTM